MRFIKRDFVQNNRLRLRQAVTCRNAHGVYVEGGRDYRGPDLATFIKTLVNEGIRIRSGGRASETAHARNAFLSLRQSVANESGPLSEVLARSLARLHYSDSTHTRFFRRALRRVAPQRWAELAPHIRYSRQEWAAIWQGWARRDWALGREVRTASGMAFYPGYPVDVDDSGFHVTPDAGFNRIPVNQSDIVEVKP